MSDALTTEPEISNTDEDLLFAIAKADEVAFEELVRRYRDRIYRLTIGMLKNAAEAEEVCQELFFTIFKKAHTYKGKSSASTWIYRIATNCALMKLRRQTKTPTLAVENGWLGFEEGYRAPLESVAKWPTGPENSYLNNEIRTHIEHALMALPEKYRIVLLLKDVEGLSLAEISQTLGLTVASVKSRLHRSRLYVREQLDTFFKENHHG